MCVICKSEPHEARKGYPPWGLHAGPCRVSKGCGLLKFGAFENLEFPGAATTAYYGVLRRTTTHYDVLRRSTAYYDVLRRTQFCFSRAWKWRHLHSFVFPGSQKHGSYTVLLFQGLKMTTVTHFAKENLSKPGSLKNQAAKPLEFWKGFGSNSFEEPKGPGPKCRQLHIFGHPGAQRASTSEALGKLILKHIWFWRNVFFSN